MPTALAIDTATAACSAALWRSGAVAAGRFEIMHRGHAENLMPMVDAVMTEAGAAPDTLDLIAVTVGPGAFTGLRLGLAAARGLALATGAPCMGLTTTETLAAAVAEASGAATGAIVAALDTKRGDYYVQVFDAAGKAVSEPAVLAAADLAGFVAGHAEGRAPARLAGDVQDAVAAALGAAGLETAATPVIFPDAKVVAALAAGRFRPGEKPAPPAPLYLRRPDATPAVDGGRIRG